MNRTSSDGFTSNTQKKVPPHCTQKEFSWPIMFRIERVNDECPLPIMCRVYYRTVRKKKKTRAFSVQ